MVGNYGVPNPERLDDLGLPKGFESYKIHAAGLVVQDYAHHYSHWDAHFSLGDWLKKEGIPAIGGIDTRLLTKKIRSRGAMLGRIEFEDGAVRFCVFLFLWTGFVGFQWGEKRSIYMHMSHGLTHPTSTPPLNPKPSRSPSWRTPTRSTWWRRCRSRSRACSGRGTP